MCRPRRVSSKPLYVHFRSVGIGQKAWTFYHYGTARLGRSAMERSQIISRDPEVMNGALVFASTRVPVEILIQHLAAGDSLDKFLDDFPSVSREQVVAYLEMTLHQAETGA